MDQWVDGNIVSVDDKNAVTGDVVKMVMASVGYFEPNGVAPTVGTPFWCHLVIGVDNPLIGYVPVFTGVFLPPNVSLVPMAAAPGCTLQNNNTGTMTDLAKGDARYLSFCALSNPPFPNGALSLGDVSVRHEIPKLFRLRHHLSGGRHRAGLRPDDSRIRGYRCSTLGHPVSAGHVEHRLAGGAAAQRGAHRLQGLSSASADRVDRDNEIRRYGRPPAGFLGPDDGRACRKSGLVARRYAIAIRFLSSAAERAKSLQPPHFCHGRCDWRQPACADLERPFIELEFLDGATLVLGWDASSPERLNDVADCG